jgi:hypothetical protein
MLNAETQDRFWASPRGIYAGLSGMWKGFLRVFLFPPVSIIPPEPHIDLHLHVALIRTNGRKLGACEWGNIVTKMGEHGKKTLYFAFRNSKGKCIYVSVPWRLALGSTQDHTQRVPGFTHSGHFSTTLTEVLPCFFLSCKANGRV